jgi:hypothetical protein
VVYNKITEVEPELGHPIQVTFRPGDWLESGTDSFHDTVVSRSLVQIVGVGERARNEAAAVTASVAH